VRYRLSLGALGLMALCPLVTADRLSQRAADPPASVAPDRSPKVAEPEFAAEKTEASSVGEMALPTGRRSGGGASAVQSRALADLSRRLEPWLPWLVGLWLAGVLLLSIRLLGGLSRARRIAREGSAPRSAFAAVFARLAQRLGIDAGVDLLESTALAVPAVIGWLRPVVLLPAAAAAGLTPQQLELLLAHELAHVRRNDYFVNLVQSVVEILLFYHPAVWWVSARVREEREHCCDDLALAACGHPREYAGALLALATGRVPLPVPAAVGSGTLVRRVRRILGQDAGAVELGPFWVAGVLAAGLALGVVAGLQATAPDPTAGEESGAAELGEVAETADAEAARADTGPARPDTIIRYTGQEPLGRRWQWARSQAQAGGFRGYWIGYVVPAPDESRPWQYLDRHVPVRAGDARLSGHLRFMGGWNDLKFNGTALTPLLGEQAPHDLAILLGYAVDGSAAGLVRVHLSNWVFPVHFGGWPLLWLGQAGDVESVEQLRALYGQVGADVLRKDLIGMVAAHGDAAAAVPALAAWLASDQREELRGHAAEGLAQHPVPEALAALDRAARTDRARAVRAESIEALGELELPAATEALTDLVESADDRRLRAEAVEALGDRRDAKARSALDALIQDDTDVELQRVAVEALGKLPDGAGLRDLLEIARRHRSYQVRAEAVETLGEVGDAGAVLEPLAEIARSDPHPAVQRVAVETLGDLDDPRAFPLLVDLATEHQREEVQRTAVEALESAADPATVLPALARIARSHPRQDVQVAAVEGIGEIEHPEVAATLAGIAREHPRQDVRRQAVEALGSAVPVEAAFEALEDIVWRHPDYEVQMEAAETLGELDLAAAAQLLGEIVDRHPRIEVQMEAVEALGDNHAHETAIGALRRLIENHPSGELRRHAVERLGQFEDPEVTAALLEYARAHRDVEVRREAVETLGEREAGSAAVDLLAALVRDDPDPELREEALEALSELPDGAGVPALIETARSHPDRKVRVRAIELLGESEDPRALEVLRNLIRP
jgi:HEAT repeat protein